MGETRSYVISFRSWYGNSSRGAIFLRLAVPYFILYVAGMLLLEFAWPTPRVFTSLIVSAAIASVLFGLLILALIGSKQVMVTLADDFIETKLGRLTRCVQRNRTRRISEVKRITPLDPRRGGLVVRDKNIFAALTSGFIFVPDCIPEYPEIKQRLAQWAPIKQGW